MTYYNPLVSIIMPTFNRSYCLSNAINSVINQTYSNWELIIVDNFSKDNTSELVNSFKKKNIKFYQIHNKGIIAKSRNYGISKSLGEILCFLDSDDWWNKQKLQIEVNLINKGYEFIYSDMYLNYFKIKGFRKRTRTRKLKNPIFNDLLINGNAINNSSVTLKRDLFFKSGGFKEDLNYVTSEDFFLWLNISKITNKFFKSNYISGYLTIGGDNATSLDKTTKSMFAIYHFYKDELSKLKMKPVGLWYTLSRANYNNSNYQKSILYSLKVLIYSNNFQLKIKSILTITTSIIRFLVK